jgi:hypothetical protein
VLRLRSLLDEVSGGFIDLVVLGLMGNYGWGCFRPEAGIRESCARSHVMVRN